MELFEVQTKGRGRTATDWPSLLKQAAIEPVFLGPVATKPATKKLDSVRAMAASAKLAVRVYAANTAADGSGKWYTVLEPSK